MHEIVKLRKLDEALPTQVPGPSQGIDRVDCRHIEEIRDIAAKSFPKVWNEKDFAYFLAHETGFSFGVFAELADGKRRLLAYFIALLVQGDLDVISVATRPELRRKGIAAGLVKYACRRPEVARSFLEVDTENQPAIDLYGKLGFEIVGRRKGYYEKQRDAFVMRRTADTGRVLN